MPKGNLVSHGRQFVAHVLPAIIRPIRTLWHEVIGFLFLALAVIFCMAGIREWNSERASMVRVAMSIFLTVLMGSFGISSFRRARKISRP